MSITGSPGRSPLVVAADRRVVVVGVVQPGVALRDRDEARDDREVELRGVEQLRWRARARIRRDRSGYAPPVAPHVGVDRRAARRRARRHDHVVLVEVDARDVGAADDLGDLRDGVVLMQPVAHVAPVERTAVHDVARDPADHRVRGDERRARLRRRRARSRASRRRSGRAGGSGMPGGIDRRRRPRPPARRSARRPRDARRRHPVTVSLIPVGACCCVAFFFFATDAARDAEEDQQHDRNGPPMLQPIE